MISEIVVWNVEIVVRNVPCSMWFSAVLTDMDDTHGFFPYLPYDICLTFLDIGYNKDTWQVASIHNPIYMNTFDDGAPRYHVRLSPFKKNLFHQCSVRGELRWAINVLCYNHV